MSTYRFIQDAYVGTQYFYAGTTASTADVGGQLPAGWIPGPCVDPLDTPAINAFYAAGPYATPLARTQWVNLPVTVPAVYWHCVNPATGA
jgi:hypothetical protein